MYCDTANTFISAADNEVWLEPRSRTPMALNVECPECERIFKKLPRKKDGTVWVALHALPKRRAQDMEINLSDAAYGSAIFETGNDVADAVHRLEAGEAPSEGAVAFEAEAEVARQAREAALEAEADDPTSVLSETLAAIA